MYQPTRADIAHEGAYLAQNMQVIGAGKSVKTRIFRNLICGHELEVGTSEARNGGFCCRKCKEKKWENEAKDVGLTLCSTFVKNGSTFGNYKCNNCGNDHYASLSCVRAGSTRCINCFNEKLRKEAELAGIIYVEKIDADSARYHMPCGHEQIITCIQVRTKQFKCKSCLDQKLHDEADSVELEFHGKTGPNSAKYVFKDCGHDQIILCSNVRVGKFRCQKCEQTWATRPSNLYLHLIEYDGNVLLKFGRARNVKRRSVQYGLPVGSKLKILQVWPTKTGIEADRIESLVSKKFNKYNKSKSKLVLQESGWTECYDIEDQQAILDFVEQHIIQSNHSAIQIGLH